MALTTEAHAHNLAATSLRFFNVAGAYKDAGERHNPETHIIPLTIHAITGKRDKFTLFGTDYPTPDGTCVRDYIHVLDLARAIEMALSSTPNGEHRIYNLGTGTGFSNQQLVDTVKKVTGEDFVVEYGDRRPGDPPTLVAGNQLAREGLGWEPKHSTLEEMIGDAWRFHQEVA
jgi:UDP-glucose 4-epimerase